MHWLTKHPWTIDPGSPEQQAELKRQWAAARRDYAYQILSQDLARALAELERRFAPARQVK